MLATHLQTPPEFDLPWIEDLIQSSMRQYKRNQVEEAIFRTLGARERGRRTEVSHQAAVGDRSALRLRCPLRRRRRSPLRFLQSGATGFRNRGDVLRVRGVRAVGGNHLAGARVPSGGGGQSDEAGARPLEAAHAQILKKDPPHCLMSRPSYAQAKPGMIAADNTDPVFLAFVRARDSSVGDHKGSGPVAVCRGHDELVAFIRKHSIPGMGATFFEFVRLMHGTGGQSFAGPPRQARPGSKLNQRAGAKLGKAGPIKVPSLVRK